jgi:two-component system cell cycle response regulator DivK
MDVQLPVMSGLEATRLIKANPDLRDTPIVALTAKAMKGDRQEILAAGCDEYLAKPLDLTKVKSIVQKTAHVPVILITAHSTSSQWLQSKRQTTG